MRKFNLHNIRARLTLGNILVFGGILVVYAFGTSYFFLTILKHQLDESLKEELELATQLLLHSPSGNYDIDEHGAETNPLERFVEMWSTDGRLLYRSETLGARTLGDAPSAADLQTGIRIHSRVLDDMTSFRVASTLDMYQGRARFVRLAVNEAAYFQDVRNFIRVLLVGIPLALLFIAVSAYVMARRALKPIDTMVATARRIGSDNLIARLPIINPEDELGRLATAFNELLARVQHSFDQLKRFTSDASHELRTPLTAMRSVGEIGLQTNRSEGEYRELIGSMLEESSRLARLVDSLLFLSRADSGKHQLRRERLDLLHFAQSSAGLITILAEEKEQRFVINGSSGVFVNADSSLLSQALLNLLDNAIKFSPTGTEIAITVGNDGEGTAFLDVVDSGVSIPATERERIFERFYRLANEGERHGTGLGLAISRWAVEANGGSLFIMNDKAHSGNTFRITLPFLAENLKRS
jgi:heavy metal sensor kinase